MTEASSITPPMEGLVRKEEKQIGQVVNKLFLLS